jgi:hypothetical protein
MARLGSRRGTFSCGASPPLWCCRACAYGSSGALALTATSQLPAVTLYDDFYPPSQVFLATFLPAAMARQERL